MSEPLEVVIIGNHVRNVTAEAAASGAIARHGLVSDQSVMWNMAGDYFYQYKDPLDIDSVVEFHDPELRSRLKLPDEEEEQQASGRPRPTTATPPPPEFIPDNAQARAVCLSPDVCRTPEKPIPYVVWGQGCDDRNYSPNVRSNGDTVKHAQSVFTSTYGDEPGIGKGVCSGTVGQQVEPVTSSDTVRVNGIPTQRHSDRCTMNNGNCPGEYVHVQSVDTHSPPDATDEEDRNQAQKGWDGFYENSAEAQMIGDGLKRAGDYIGDPSLIGQDIEAGIDAIPTFEEAKQWGSDVATGIGNKAQDVWNDPGGAAEDAWNWGVDSIKGAWDGTVDAYDEGGVSQAGGHVLAGVLGVINPFRKAKMVGTVADGLGDVGQAARRLERHDGPDGHRPPHDRHQNESESNRQGGDGKGDTNNGQNGVRSSRTLAVRCFDLPRGVDRDEFRRQLKEQQDTIGKMTADEMAYAHTVLDHARDAWAQSGRKGSFTNLLRDGKAQEAARAEFEGSLREQGLSRAEIREQMASVNATHYLDIIAGGDPSDLGIGGGAENQRIGPMWTQEGRAESLRAEANRLRAEGHAGQLMNVDLKICGE
jgi:hypothetical protein